MAIERIRKNGKVIAYRANVYYKGERHIGQRRHKKADAELDEVNLKKSLLTGTHFRESSMTLDEGYNDYLTLIAPKRLSLAALNSTKSYYTKHIKPVFGFREMTSIKPREIQRFFVEKENDLANSSIIKLYTIMNQIYKTMIEWKEIKDNPLTGVQKPSPNHRKIKTWTKEEAQKFLSVAKEYQAFMAFWLALNFGLRLSEILGLEWKHVNFTKGILEIRQAYHEVEKKIGGLKSKSAYRDIPISTQQLEMLKKHKRNQSIKTNLVVATQNGNHMMQGNIRHTMRRICERTGVKVINFHALRHTHATLLLEINEHIKIVQQRLGDAKAETTINIYSHVRPKVHEDSAQRFSDFFEG